MALAHHNLVAWQRADDLFIAIHRLTHRASEATPRLTERAERREAHGERERAAHRRPTEPQATAAEA